MIDQKYRIMIIVTAVCAAMGWIDAVLQPGYAVKSGIKIVLFLALPCLDIFLEKDDSLKEIFHLNKKWIRTAVLSGAAIYTLIVGGYFLFRNVFDFSTVTASLNQSVGVTKDNFVWVALYISFINSLLEEFFFRGYTFFTLKKLSSRRSAYLFSSSLFALYHVAMMLGWFRIDLTMLSLAGLLIGGLLFDWCNEKSGNIYMSWLIHMFANFGINTVGFILFGIL